MMNEQYPPVFFKAQRQDAIFVVLYEGNCFMRNLLCNFFVRLAANYRQIAGRLRLIQVQTSLVCKYAGDRLVEAFVR